MEGVSDNHHPFLHPKTPIYKGVLGILCSSLAASCPRVFLYSPLSHHFLLLVTTILTHGLRSNSFRQDRSAVGEEVSECRVQLLGKVVIKRSCLLTKAISETSLGVFPGGFSHAAGSMSPDRACCFVEVRILSLSPNYCPEHDLWAS